MSEAREEFEAWLAVMDRRLDAFRRELPPDVAARLDGSVESLDALEAWLLERYDGPAAMRNQDETSLVNGAMRYLGEVIHRHAGGHWDIELEKQHLAHARVPIIRGVAAMPLAPLFLLSAATDRRTGTYLRELVERLG